MVNFCDMLEAENQNPIQIPVFNQFIKRCKAFCTNMRMPNLIETSFQKGEKQKERSQGLKLFIILSKEEVK